MSGEMKSGAASIDCAIEISAASACRSGRYRKIRLHSPVVAAGVEGESAGGGHRQFDIAIVRLDAARSRQ